MLFSPFFIGAIMKPDTRQHKYFTCRGDILEPTAASVVNEYPLQLIVNGREIATLIGSPHDLRFLVAGFLRLQGFVSSLNDFEMFSVCEEFGTANVRIKGELPERLKPVLTSGCGTGITFTLPTVAENAPQPVRRRPLIASPDILADEPVDPKSRSLSIPWRNSFRSHRP